MSALFPEYVSPNGQQFVFTLASEEASTYICSSTKLRKAIAEVLNNLRRPAPDAALHYKEAAASIIKSVKEVTGTTLEAVTFEDAEGRFLTITPSYFQHNFPPTPVEDTSAEPSSPIMSDRQKEIRARLEKLAL